MAQTHKRVWEAVAAVMQHADYGFNKRLQDALPSYIPDYTIEQLIQLSWDPDADQVSYIRLAASDVAVSRLKGRLTLMIVPNSSQYTQETLGVKWSGRVGVNLVFQLKYAYREQLDDPPEDQIVMSIATAIEDAVIEVFQTRGIRWGDFGVIYANPPDCPEGYIFDSLSDGAQVTIPIHIGFRVDVSY